MRYSTAFSTLAFMLLLGTVACRDDLPSPTGPPDEPQTEVEEAPTASAIYDAAHSDQVEHFYFLPPMVAGPEADGTFDASLSPAVEVCELDEGGAEPTCGELIAAYDGATGAGSENVRLEAEDEHYIVNWHTDEFELDDGATYRVVVRVGGTTLGWADVDVVNGGKDLKNVDSGEFIALKDGRTLPVKFRLEEGAVFVADEDGASIEAEDGAVRLDVPAGAVSGDLGITVRRIADPAEIDEIPDEVAALPGAVFDFGPDGTTFGEPVELTIAFDESEIPSDADITRLAIYTREAGEWIELPTIIDFEAKTATAVIEGFSLKVVGVSGADRRTCALAATGDIYCWGGGHLGDGETSRSRTPVKVLGGPYVELKAGVRATCALRADGTAACWGSGEYGELGNGSRRSWNVPVTVSGGGYTSLASGVARNCALKHDGSADCWGYGWSGELGNGAHTLAQATPVQILGGPYTALSLGGRHSCGLRYDGIAECWGHGSDGQLGNGAQPVAQLTPVVVAGGPYIELSSGRVHTCGLKADGTIECWGSGRVGQLGNGSMAHAQATPVEIQGGPYAHLGEASGYHSCAILLDGLAHCWGHGEYGQLGNGTLAHSAVPVEVHGGPYTSIHAGSYTTCALTPVGNMECWGENRSGQVGTGAAGASVTTPTPVVGLPTPGPSITPLPASRVSAGEAASCHVTLDQRIECWGSGGALGGAIGGIGPALTPTRIDPPAEGPQQWAMVSMSEQNDYACALTIDGEAYCWGDNHYGQLGDGSNSYSLQPTRVVDPAGGPQTWIWVTAGISHGCAVAESGDAYCWGRNEFGHLGNGTTTHSSVPTRVVDPDSGSRRYLRVSANTSHTCAIDYDGEAFCWGAASSFNRLGNPSVGTGFSTIPVPVTDADSRRFVAVDAGNSHSCGITTDDDVFCWGYGGNARTAIAGSGTFVSITAGAVHSCAVTASEQLLCAGDNNHGQLGYPGPYVGAPAEPAGGYAFKSVSAGHAHTCAIRDDDETVCWGFNENGQAGPVGFGSYTDSPQELVLPPPSVTPRPAARVSAGEHAACRVTADQRIECWGWSSAIGGASFAPKQIDDPSEGPQQWEMVSLSLREDFGCALTEAGDAYCWGVNSHGQLGQGTNAYSWPPGRVSDPAEGPRTWTWIAAGGRNHACGVTGEGDAYCWGQNSFGELGDGTTSDRNVPVKVQPTTDGPRRWLRISAGTEYTCGLTYDGEAYCWGRNTHGQLGDGSGISTTQPTPVAAAGTRRFVALASAGVHTCTLTTDASPFCWGSSGQGRRGISGTAGTFRSITTGTTHSCAVTTGGQALCTGYNGQGQLGTETVAFGGSSGIPVEPDGGHQFESISGGDANTCAERSDGETLCWGNNNAGQLGDGTYANRNHPVLVGTSPLVAGMVGAWFFDENPTQTQAQSVLDLVAGRNGYRGSSNTVDPSEPDRLFPGRAGGSMSFDYDGASPLTATRREFIVVPNDPALEPATDVSVEAWVRASGSPGAYAYIVAKGAETCSHVSYGLYTYNHGGLNFYAGTGGPLVRSPHIAPASIWDGQWHHVMGTYDGAMTRLYVDGLEIGSGVADTGPIDYGLSTHNDLYIGSYEYQGGCTGGFRGDIDDVVIWNRALTSAEVAARAAQ